eukprot:13818633-Alexandrium_andersonii.AAC.1
MRRRLRAHARRARTQVSPGWSCRASRTSGEMATRALFSEWRADPPRLKARSHRRRPPRRRRPGMTVWECRPR